MYRKRNISLCLVSLLIAASACRSPQKESEAFYSEADFKKVKKIDIHCHVNNENTFFMEQAIEDNFRIVTVNVNAGSPVTQQQEGALFQLNKFPGHIAYITTFSMEGWQNPDWQQKTMDYLKNSFEKGAIGVKVWKNIGMVEKDGNGDFIMIDNPKFDPIFNYLEEQGIPVLGHLGEPRNCWLPVEEMTVNNDKNYFKRNPQYHMYLHPEYPSYEEQLAARDRRLEKHPRLQFVGAHLASLEWSVDKMGEFLDRFPNATIETAARMCHLQVQAQENRQKVRDFFIKYQDRIIYGTDEGAGNTQDPEKKKEELHEQWMRDWKFLTGEDTLSSWKVNGAFKGLKLPREVVDKVYRQNAERVFAEFKTDDKILYQTSSPSTGK